MLPFLPFACALLLQASAEPSSATPAAPCDTWMHSVAGYDARVDAVLDGQEVEHLLTLLQHAQQPDPDGQAGSLPQLARLVESRMSRLGDIDPPAELAALHQRLLDFHEAVLEAAVRPPRETGRAAVPINRECYQTLLAYFEQLHADLAAHQCAGGDAEALQQRVIPQLRAILGALSDNDD